MGRKTTTSVKVDEGLWKEAKIEAIKRGMTVGELLTEALRKELKTEETASHPTLPPRNNR